MPQFDKLLAAMVSNKADSLVLDDGDLVKVEVGGQLRPLTKTPLAGAQIVALCKEIAKPEAAKSLDEGKPATMSYITNDGAFVVRAMINNGKWHIVAKIDDRAEFKRLTGQFKAMELPPETPAKAQAVVPTVPTPPPTPAPAPAAPPAKPAMATATAPPASVVGISSKSELDLIQQFPGMDEAKEHLDRLLKSMVEKGASDLHLRVTEPPVLRHHGEMERQEGERLGEDQLYR